MAAGGVRLLFDEHFSHLLVEFVRRESRLAQMDHVRSRGWNGTEDTVWILLAVDSGSVIITADRNEVTRRMTVADLKRLGATVILVGPFWDHIDVWQRARWLVNSIERIVDLASSMEPGSVRLIDRRVRRTPQ